MENKVRAGDVWWNIRDNYGKMYIQVDTSMPNIVTPYLVHNKHGGSGSNQVWESGGLEQVGCVMQEHWKFLYNTTDITSISLRALNEEHST